MSSPRSPGSDFESLSLTEVIQLQNHLSEMVKRRFERTLALAFTDIVGSSTYFARFGDEAGRRLQQEHIDALDHATRSTQGWIIDTAGDGAFVAYPSVPAATTALTELLARTSQSNSARQAEHQLLIRCGVHWGAALNDGKLVTGDAVNLCARVASSASGGEIRVTKAAFLELPHNERLRCRTLPPESLKGIPNPVDMLRYEWRDSKRFPSTVMVDETGQTIALPSRDTITFGRLGEVDGMPGNDVVLLHPDRALAAKVSRWHFELRRHATGFVLRTVSNNSTEVDGHAVEQGKDVPVLPSSVIKLAGVLTLRFAMDAADRPGNEQLLPTMGDVGHGFGSRR
jgi:class 3 adenylate cyclase